MGLRLAARIQSDSIVDGEGIRAVIWTQGCIHHCPGCHNPETHDLHGGREFSLEEIYSMIDDLENQDGLTFSGGDPFMQAEACSKIAAYGRKKGYDIWCYTGYTFEELLALMEKDESIKNFLKEIDVLVDGRFILKEKSLDVLFRGSKNQRIIDVPKSLVAKKAVTIAKYDTKFQHLNRTKKEGVFL